MNCTDAVLRLRRDLLQLESMVSRITKMLDALEIESDPPFEEASLRPDEETIEGSPWCLEPEIRQWLAEHGYRPVAWRAVNKGERYVYPHEWYERDASMLAEPSSLRLAAAQLIIEPISAKRQPDPPVDEMEEVKKQPEPEIGVWVGNTGLIKFALEGTQVAGSYDTDTMMRRATDAEREAAGLPKGGAE